MLWFYFIKTFFIWFYYLIIWTHYINLRIYFGFFPFLVLEECRWYFDKDFIGYYNNTNPFEYHKHRISFHFVLLLQLLILNYICFHCKDVLPILTKFEVGVIIGNAIAFLISILEHSYWLIIMSLCSLFFLFLFQHRISL